MSLEDAISARLPTWIMDEMPLAHDGTTSIPSRTTKAPPRGRGSRGVNNSGVEALAAAITATSAQSTEFSKHMLTLLLGKRRERSPESTEDEDDGQASPQPEAHFRSFSPAPAHDQEMEWFVRDCRREKSIVMSLEVIAEHNLNLQHLAAGFINSQMLVTLLKLKKRDARLVVRYAKEWYLRLEQKRACLNSTVIAGP
jgi:hypothetical protein